MIIIKISVMVVLIKKVSDRSVNQYGDIPSARKNDVVERKRKKIHLNRK